MKFHGDRRTTIKALENEAEELNRKLDLLRSAIIVLQQLEGEENIDLPTPFNNVESKPIRPTKTDRGIYELLLPLFQNPRAYTVGEMFSYITEHPSIKGAMLQKSDASFRYTVQKLYKANLLYRFAAEGQSNDKKYWYSTPEHFIENGYPNPDLKRYITDALHEYYKRSLLNEGG